MTRTRLGAVLLVLALASVLIAAPEPAKPKAAWEWTDAERAAQRLDENAVAARLEAYRESRPAKFGITSLSGEQAPAELRDVISGERDPHLFFASELFQHMIAFAYADDELARSTYRYIKEPLRKELGLPPDFWIQLEGITAAYRAGLNRYREIALSGRPEEEIEPELRDVGAMLCRDRAASLKLSRATFGQPFERFLYAGVAPGMISVSRLKPDAKSIRVGMGGCE